MQSRLSALRLALPVVLAFVFMYACIQCGGDDGSEFAPTIELLECPPDTVLHGVPCTFRWRGTDRDGHVVGYCHGLNDDTPETWTTADSCTLLSAPSGRNVFFVQAIDNRGYRSEVVSCAFVVEGSCCLVQPTALDFGGVDVGQSLDMSFVVSNVAQTVVSGEVRGSGDDYEILSGSGTFSLDMGDTHTVTVRFSPDSCGIKTSTIDTGNDICADVSCSGEGIGGRCSISPTSLEFGTVTPGGSLERSFTISNTGCTILSGTVRESCDDYSVAFGASYSLEPGESHVVTLLFAPTSCGRSQCEIRAGNETCPTISCTGLGGGSACEVHPKTLDFRSVAKGSEKLRSFWIKNTGCAELEGYLTEDCSVYSIDSDPHWILAPGALKEIVVRFSPMSLDDNTDCWIDLGNALADSVFCTGEVGCHCWVSDEDRYHYFGRIEPDHSVSKEFVIRNLETYTLDLHIRLKPGCLGGFAIRSGGGDHVLAPNDEHSVLVRFSPGEEPSYECFLDLDECGEIRLVGDNAGGGDPPIPP